MPIALGTRQMVSVRRHTREALPERQGKASQRSCRTWLPHPVELSEHLKGGKNDKLKRHLVVLGVR